MAMAASSDTQAPEKELDTPILLLAMPQVVDPFFHKSVVLLIHHQSEGSLGFIVNRPTNVSVSDVLEGLEIEWHGDGKQAVHFGGPVQPQLGTVIYRCDEAPDSDSQQIIYSGVSMTQNLRDLAQLAEKPPLLLRLFLGYAGWGDGQLMREILRNDWLTAPVSHDLVFATDPDSVWDQALQSVGVDPSQLPSWTSDGGDDLPAN